jgi:DNA-binding beta-propeller fold protein YncE
MVSSIGYSQDILDAKDFQSNFSSSDFYLGKQKTVQNPKGMDFDHLGQYLFIANMWGPTPRNVNLTVMSANSMEVIKEIPLPNGYYSKVENMRMVMLK